MNYNLGLTVSIGKIVVDLIILLTIYIIPFLIISFGTIEQRGFFCNDESIRYPYNPIATVNSNYVFAGETIIVAVMILVCEVYINFSINEKFRIGNCKLPIYVWKIYASETAFIFGLICNRLTYLMWKYQIGRLRPHFYDACMPNINCTDPRNALIYHTNFNCTNPLYKDNVCELTQIRSSFPSGQMAYSIYCTLYLIIYLENNILWTWKGYAFLKYAIQFAAFNSSMYIGFINITEFRHHPSDILAGFLLGSGFAILAAVYVGRLYLNLKQPISTEYEKIS